jgi:paraquat-inducible protein B
VTFDLFDQPGIPATEADIFQLYNNQPLAAATSTPVNISFKFGRGLLAGKSELRYLGVPVGVVEQIYPKDGAVEVVARFRSGHDQLRRNGTTFAIVEPVISLQGVTGIETLLSGVYIQCIPGKGDGYANSFVGVTTSDPQILQEEGFELQLTTAETRIQPGAQIVYRSTEVGEVTGKSISDDGQRVILDIRIDTEYQHLVRDNSRFWDASTLEASIGFIKLKIKTGALLGPTGRIALASPEMAGGQAAEGAIFELYDTPQEKALRRFRD